jgi:hypothetical protein
MNVFKMNPDDVSALSQITLAELITRQETSRMNYILKQQISQLTLDRLTTGVFARYRDDRLQQVGPQKVRHELNAFSVVLRAAKLDWDIPLRDIPLDHIRKPKIPPGRDRRLHMVSLRNCVRRPYTGFLRLSGQSLNLL